MKYCPRCGAPAEENDKFCARCGRGIETRNRLCCELAYTGTLFWLPLLICPRKKDARFHANQGL